VVRRPLLRVVLAVAGSVVAAVLLIPLRDHVENTNLALVLVIVVLLSAVLGGRSAGIAAALSSAVAFDFFLTRPFLSPRITTRDDLQTTLLLAVIGLVAGELVERARRSGAEAAATQGQLDAIYRRAELAAGTDEPGRLVQLAAEELTRLLELKSCEYVPGRVPTSMAELTHNSIRVPGDVDPSARGLVALPVRAHGRLLGHLVMSFPTTAAGLALTSDQRHAAVAIADQVGVGLLRFRNG
jgi:K+-sensing histidine kinase KdpD